MFVCVGVCVRVCAHTIACFPPVMCSPRPRQRSDAVGGEGERGVGGPSPWAVAHDRGVTTAAALRCGGEKKNNEKENEKFLLENHAHLGLTHTFRDTFPSLP